MALEDYYGQTCWCVKCKQCMLAYYPVMMRTCPAGERFKFLSYYAPGKMAVARYLLDGTLDYNDSVAELAYTCTLCGCCEEICQRTGPRFEPRKIIEELRVECYSRGLIYPEHKAIVDSVRNYGNVWQQPRAMRDAWSRDLGIKRAVSGGSKVLYFVGCTYAYQPSLHAVARATARIMDAAGVDFSIMGLEEMCCGSPIQKVGDRELFSRVAGENIERINDLGVDTVVISCAGCYSTFKVDYEKEGDMRFEVVSSVEFVLSLMEEGLLELKGEGERRVVTYHDPCHLGRRSAPPDGTPCFMLSLGVYDAPRRLLEALPGVELREMQRIREYTWCCGAGGGLKSAFPDVALWSARERIEEAGGTGAGALVTACPWCEANLADATEGQGEMDILDLILMVSEAMA